jgi:glutamine amidotransferase
VNVVAIVDYGLCNLDSVARAVEECGGAPVVTEDPRDVARADRIILPGVGAFPMAMRRLRERSLDTALSDRVLGQGVPFLGICLGMQLLASTGLEVEETPGLGWIDGVVRRLETTDPKERVPHIGWNHVAPVRDCRLFGCSPAGDDFYFVHSYHLCPARPEDVVGRTDFGGGFVSAVQRDSVFGVQFHPEKSQRAGFRILRDFMAV